MTGEAGALLGLVIGTALHLGFQLTVTAVVYPALASAPDFAIAHARHTRRITPLVALVYGALVLTTAVALVVTWSDPWVVLAAAGGGLSVLTTAAVAAPAHGRLASGRDHAVLDRLLLADRVRTVGGLVALLAAAAALADAV